MVHIRVLYFEHSNQYRKFGSLIGLRYYLKKKLEESLCSEAITAHNREQVDHRHIEISLERVYHLAFMTLMGILNICGRRAQLLGLLNNPIICQALRDHRTQILFIIDPNARRHRCLIRTSQGTIRVDDLYWIGSYCGQQG